MKQNTTVESAAPVTLTLSKETIRTARVVTGVKAGAVPRTNRADCNNSVVRCQTGI